jgi:hypothetical protein
VAISSAPRRPRLPRRGPWALSSDFFLVFALSPGVRLHIHERGLGILCAQQGGTVPDRGESVTSRLSAFVVRRVLPFAAGSGLFAAMLLHPGLSSAQLDLPASSAATEEILLFQEIPSVFGASKYEQKVTPA